MAGVHVTFIPAVGMVRNGNIALAWYSRAT